MEKILVYKPSMYESVDAWLNVLIADVASATTDMIHSKTNIVFEQLVMGSQDDNICILWCVDQMISAIYYIVRVLTM